MILSKDIQKSLNSPKMNILKKSIDEKDSISNSKSIKKFVNTWTNSSSVS